MLRLGQFFYLVQYRARYSHVYDAIGFVKGLVGGVLL